MANTQIINGWGGEPSRRSIPLALVASILLHLVILGFLYFTTAQELEGFFLQEISLVDAGSIGKVAGGESAGGRELAISEEGATYLNQELKRVRKKISRLKRLDATDLEEMRKEAPLGLAAGGARHDDITSEFGSGSLLKGGDASGVKLDMQGRRLLHKVMPEYPAWAEKQGVEGEVIVEVSVLPNGLVRSEVSVIRTSGFKELDHLVLETVKEWTFEELPPGAPALEQKGRINFSFDFD